jgi:Ca2+-binding RTX toxin-like protein
MTIRSVCRTGTLVVVAFIVATLLPLGTATAGSACTITGTQGNDRLVGTNGDDVICGFDGNDRIFGRRGRDVIRGGRGNDELFGHAGADVIVGGAGSDFMIPGGGGDIARGGRGRDFSSVQSAGPDTWRGGPGLDHLTDFRGADRVFGGAGGDTCLATQDGVGNDVIHGGSGRDIGDTDAADTVLSVEVQGLVCFAD